MVVNISFLSVFLAVLITEGCFPSEGVRYIRLMTEGGTHDGQCKVLDREGVISPRTNKQLHNFVTSYEIKAALIHSKRANSFPLLLLSRDLKRL